MALYGRWRESEGAICPVTSRRSIFAVLKLLQVTIGAPCRAGLERAQLFDDVVSRIVDRALLLLEAILVLRDARSVSFILELVQVPLSVDCSAGRLKRVVQSTVRQL